MRSNCRALASILVLPLASAALAAAPPPRGAPSPLKLIQSIPLDGVEGRIDQMTMDPTTDRLFVAALGNNSVEVVDLKTGKRAGRIEKLSQPQGVCWIAEFSRLA